MRVGKSPLTWDTVQSSSATYTVSSGDLSNTNLWSAPIRVEHLSKYAIQLSITGASPTGTFTLEGSNSAPADTGTGLVQGGDASAFIWTTIDGSDLVVAAAATHVWNVADVGYRWVRVKWTETPAATGNVAGEFVGKGES